VGRSYGHGVVTSDMTAWVLPHGLLGAVLFGALLGGSGVVDQSSPIPSAPTTFDASDPAKIWQQQVRGGVGGELTGIRVRVGGPAGARVTMRIRPGSGWSIGRAAFETTLVTSTPGGEDFYVDTSAAHFPVRAGRRFVIELQGDGSGAVLHGSSVASDSDPLYDEPLFLSGPRCFDSCRSRLGFETFVQDGDITAFCIGRKCPCDNDTGAGGCRNSIGSGAKLYWVNGSTSAGADDLELVAASLPRGASCLFLLGTRQGRAPFGAGVLCAGDVLVRIAGRASERTGATDLTGIVSRSHGLIGAGSAWIAQVWYRDVAGPCGGRANLTNALRIVYGP
jgi:hypothetical protein